MTEHTHVNGVRIRHALDWLIRIALALMVPAFALLWAENRNHERRIDALLIQVTEIKGDRFTDDDGDALEERMRRTLETVRDNEIERAAETHAEMRRRIEILERR